VAGGSRFVEDVTRSAQAPIASQHDQTATRPTPPSQTSEAAPQASRPESSNRIAPLEAPAPAAGEPSAASPAATGKPSAVSGPSYAETVEFIQNRTPELCNVDYAFTTSEGFPSNLTLKLQIRVSGSKITVEEDSTLSIDRSHSSFTEKYLIFSHNYVSVADLTELSTEIDKAQKVRQNTNYNYCGLKLRCSNAECFSETETIDYNMLPQDKPIIRTETPTLERSIVVPTNSPSSCDRLQSALSHLIKLAGGSAKKDPF
jgi:hypothetical protein